MIVAAGLLHDSFIGAVSVFWLLIIAADFFFDGGSAIMGPPSSQIDWCEPGLAWPNANEAGLARLVRTKPASFDRL